MTVFSPFSIFADILFAPDVDDDAGNGDEENTDVDAGNAPDTKANTPPDESDKSKKKKTVNPETRGYARGIHEGKTRTSEKLVKAAERIGISPVFDDEDELDIDATIDAIATAKAVSGTKGKKKSADDDDDESEAQKAIREANRRAEDALKSKTDYIVKGELERVVPVGAVDKEDFMNAANAMFDYKLSADGDVRVYTKGGARKRDEHGEWLTVAGVMEMIIEKKPHWIKAEARDSKGSGLSRGLTGANGKADVSKMTRDEAWQYADKKVKELNTRTRR